jgi:hypothetical protein
MFAGRTGLEPKDFRGLPGCDPKTESDFENTRVNIKSSEPGNL